jgi:hypothetical protein
MTRQKRHPGRLGRLHSEPRTPKRFQDGQCRYQGLYLRRHPNHTRSPSISPRRSFPNNEEHEPPRIWQRSSSPAPRRLGDTPFQYDDLDQRWKEIRLLRILPETTSIIKCELFRTSLYDPCPYIAISYAWGDTEDTRTIILDGHEFAVTENLMLALQRLRSRTSAVVVWADAVCINQRNTEERNLQVQAMTRIYQKAVEVAIWLGPEADNSNMALELLRNLCRHRNSETRIRTLIESLDLAPSFQALVALFDRDYWGRLWVVQEVINGNNITVYCGASSVLWDSCLGASGALQKYYSYLVLAFYVRGIANISARGRSWPGQLSCGGPAVLRDLSHNGVPAGLLDVLLYHQEKSCSEPRDRVYGLLGILSKRERSQFPVDYSRPVREVYIDVVNYLLTTTRRLDVMCASINFPVHQNIDGLPSWCPDWSQRRRILPIWNRFPGFSAGRELEETPTFSNKRRTLNISGILLDRIISCGVPLNPPICKGAMLMAFFEWRLKLRQAKWFIPFDDEAFCRTLSCGQLLDTCTPREWVEWTYHTFAVSIRGLYPELTLDHQLKSYAEIVTPFSSAERKQTLLEIFTKAMTGRCFAITCSGLLCLGSGALQVEDLICVPRGCSTPVILRKRGDAYTFIGDIYVDGYMHGKAIEDYQNGTRQVQTFMIK